MNFEQLVKQRILEHEFHPICIEHSVLLKKERKRELTPERKAQHKKYRQSEKGIKNDRERGQRYRDKHKNNPEYQAMRRENYARFRRRRKLNALWELFTYDGQGTNRES